MDLKAWLPSINNVEKLSAKNVFKQNSFFSAALSCDSRIVACDLTLFVQHNHNEMYKIFLKPDGNNWVVPV